MIFSLFEIHLDSLTHINSGHKNQKESLTQSYGQGRDSGGIESKVESYRVWISITDLYFLRLTTIKNCVSCGDGWGDPYTVMTTTDSREVGEGRGSHGTFSPIVS